MPRKKTGLLPALTRRSEAGSGREDPVQVVEERGSQPFEVAVVDGEADLPRECAEMEQEGSGNWFQNSPA